MYRPIVRKALLGMVTLAASSPAWMTAFPQKAFTYTKDVAPILNKNCVGCHRPGEIAPMSLLTYEDARPWAKSIRLRVLNGTMPPWHAEAPAGTFRNERRLTEAERTIVAEWAASGAPEGDPKDLPPQPQFVSGWTIGQPDAVVPMTREYVVRADGAVRYQYFQMPTNFTEDRWIQAIEVRPGNRNVVHHILVYCQEPRPTAQPAPFRPASPDTSAGRGGRGARIQTELLGVPVDARQTDRLGPLIATTAPGTNALVYPDGHALKIKAGSILTLQVHYTPIGREARDQSSIGFRFAKTPPQREIKTAAFLNSAFVIPHGAADHKVDSAIEFVKDTSILAIFPHTHLRGKNWEYRMVYPDGRSEAVFSVPQYDFNWQTYYEFSKPLLAPKGARLVAVAGYDNSANNRFNPDPTKDVRWGDQTWEEMQYTGITYIVNE